MEKGSTLYQEKSQFITMCYFALTTLSTVGYGEYVPKSNTEKISTVIVMMSGVAFFSYIMNEFIEIIANREAKLGAKDRSPELASWIISLQRFTSYQPLNHSIVENIYQNQNYFWENDRMNIFNKEDNY